jgi:Na+/H+ antiporter NhaD/arsenite permease-like protein
MFIVANGLEKSKYLNHLAQKFLGKAKNPFEVLIFFVFSSAIASAILLNDTIAIIGVPLAILLAKKSNISPEPLLITLALAITIGSVASPIGNPQNFLIANQPIFKNPFLDFLKLFLIPVFISLFLLSYLLFRFYKSLNKLKPLNEDVFYKSNDYWAARTAFRAILIASFLRLFFNFHLFFIAFIGAAVFLLLSRKKENLLNVDWETLIFFIGMFVLIDAVIKSQFFEQFLPNKDNLSNPLILAMASILLSQVFSNVPFVLIYLKILGEQKILTLLFLAAFSTLAGCFSIFGAASNIIILQNAEKRGFKFPIKEFTILGVSIGLISSILIFLFSFLLEFIGL